MNRRLEDCSAFRDSTVGTKNEHTPNRREWRPSPTLRHAFHASRKSRDFAGGSILMKDAARHATHDLGLGSLQRNGRSLLVAGGDGFFHLAHERSDTRPPRRID